MNNELSVHELQHIHKLFYGDMGLCACGYAWETSSLVLRFLDIAPFYENPGAVDEVIGNNGATHIVLHVMTDADLIEHGGSVRGSWLRPKGEWFRDVMRKVDDWEDLRDRLFDWDHDSHVDHLPSSHECSDNCWIT